MFAGLMSRWTTPISWAAARPEAISRPRRRISWRGNFFSRDNIHPGMVTLHPCGFTHGPHPKALQGMLTPKKGETDEVALMVDARDALDIAKLPEGVEFTAYAESWRASGRQ